LQEISSTGKSLLRASCTSAVTTSHGNVFFMDNRLTCDGSDSITNKVPDSENKPHMQWRLPSHSQPCRANVCLQSTDTETCRADVELGADAHSGNTALGSSIHGSSVDMGVEDGVSLDRAASMTCRQDLALVQLAPLTSPAACSPLSGRALWRGSGEEGDAGDDLCAAGRKTPHMLQKDSSAGCSFTSAASVVSAAVLANPGNDLAVVYDLTGQTGSHMYMRYDRQ